jgi:hypothetical protein
LIGQQGQVIFTIEPNICAGKIPGTRLILTAVQTSGNLSGGNMEHPVPQESDDYDSTRIVERPDGFYWHDEKESDKVFGPFPTLLDAIQDMEYNAESDYEPGETLEEAEDEIGISDWIDRETGHTGEESFLEN